MAQSFRTPQPAKRKVARVQPRLQPLRQVARRAVQYVAKRVAVRQPTRVARPASACRPVRAKGRRR